MTVEDMAPIGRSRVTRRTGLLALNHPPTNTLGAALRRGLWDRIAGMVANRGVDAIVILADGRLFSAGADPQDLDGAAGHTRGPFGAAGHDADCKAATAAERAAKAGQIS